MQAVINHTDYFGIAHHGTRNFVPSGFRAFVLNLFGKNRKNFGQFMTEWLSNRLLKNFGTLSLELEGIHTKLLNGELSTGGIEEDYDTIKNIIKLLTSADELFSQIDYFDNQLLKKEVKNVLNTSYLIEVELKEIVFQNKGSLIKDEMFQALTNKSKDSLSRKI